MMHQRAKLIVVLAGWIALPLLCAFRYPADGLNATTFSLEVVNDQPVSSSVALEAADQSYRFISSTITLEHRGIWVHRFCGETNRPGEPAVLCETEGGTYSVTGRRITLNQQGLESISGTLDGNEMTLRGNGQQLVYRSN
jgi:hypothetical protein